MTAATLTRLRAVDNRGARIGRAYALIAALLGREWVSRDELDVALGCHKRTTLRNIAEAQAAGLVDVMRSRPGDLATRVRLRDQRLRRHPSGEGG